MRKLDIMYCVSTGKARLAWADYVLDKWETGSEVIAGTLAQIRACVIDAIADGVDVTVKVLP